MLKTHVLLDEGADRFAALERACMLARQRRGGLVGVYLMQHAPLVSVLAAGYALQDQPQLPDAAEQGAIFAYRKFASWCSAMRISGEMRLVWDEWRLRSTMNTTDSGLVVLGAANLSGESGTAIAVAALRRSGFWSSCLVVPSQAGSSSIRHVRIEWLDHMSSARMLQELVPILQCWGSDQLEIVVSGVGSEAVVSALLAELASLEVCGGEAVAEHASVRTSREEDDSRRSVDLLVISARDAGNAWLRRTQGPRPFDYLLTIGSASERGRD